MFAGRIKKLKKRAVFGVFGSKNQQSLRDLGLSSLLPGIEMPGYFQVSLRDKEEKRQVSWRIFNASALVLSMDALAIFPFLRHSRAVTKPLALIYYFYLLPGSQMAAKLQELGYRVQTVPDLGALKEIAETEKPLVILMEILGQKDSCAEIFKLKNYPMTFHIPILAFSLKHDPELQKAATTAGASLLASSENLLVQLPQLLEQVLQFDDREHPAIPSN